MQVTAPSIVPRGLPEHADSLPLRWITVEPLRAWMTCMGLLNPDTSFPAMEPPRTVHSKRKDISTLQASLGRSQEDRHCHDAFPQAALASAIEQRLAGDQVSNGIRRPFCKPGGAARYVKLERRATEKPLADRFAKYGRSVDGPKREEEANGSGRGRSVWSADERAAAMASMDRVPAQLPLRESIIASAGRT